MTRVTALVALALLLASVAGPSHSDPAREDVAGAAAGQALGVVTDGAVHRAMEDFVRSSLAGEVEEGDRIEVRTRWQGDLLLPQAGPVEFSVKPLSSRPFRGPRVVRLEILLAGAVHKVLTLTVDTRLYREVLVSTQTVRRGAVMSDEMVELAERDVTSLRYGYFGDLAALEGMRAARPISYGDVVSRRHLEPIPVVHRGEEVLLTLESENMRLTARGTALQDGGIGTRIRVKTMDSGKVLSGLVVGAGMVHLGS